MRNRRNLGGNEAPVANWSLDGCRANSETDPKQVGFLYAVKNESADERISG